MFPLPALLHTIASMTAAESLIIIALVAGYTTGKSILVAVALGPLLAIPVAGLAAHAVPDQLETARRAAGDQASR